MPLLSQFRRSLLRQHLLQRSERVVVAVSGGPDSLALLHLLWRLREELHLHLHVAHLDHGFRGEESAAEARFVATVAHDLGLPATVERRDVTALMDGIVANKLAAARAVRYGFLAEVAQREQADVVAVAHHGDDQAETVLMHLIRGAGPAGLAGMRHSVPWEVWSAAAPMTNTANQARPPLIRPLLHVSRDTIEDYCAQHALDPRRDPSNHDLAFTRSQVRAELLPLLKQYNSRISTALAHTAQLCADDEDFITQQLDNVWRQLAVEEVGCTRMRWTVWKELHATLQRHALRRAIERLVPQKEASFDQIESLRRVLHDGGGQRPHLPGDLRLGSEATAFVLHLPGNAPSTAAADGPQINGSIAVAVPGTTRIDKEWTITVTSAAPPAWSDDRWHLVIDQEALDGPLVVRSRRAGDWFRPAGGKGSRRLQDFFVDSKLDRTLRQCWPLLTSGAQIVWIVGLRADSRFRPHGDTQLRLWLAVGQDAA